MTHAHSDQPVCFPPDPPARIWQPWPSRGWPLLAEEEQHLVDALRQAAAGKKAWFRRSAATIFLDACRFGSTLEAIRSVAPGADPSFILASYERLASKFHAAADAWARLREATVEGDVPAALSVLAEEVETLRPLAPAPTERLARFARKDPPDSEMLEALEYTFGRFDELRGISEGIEEALRDAQSRLGENPAADQVEHCRRLGLLLIEPFTGGVWLDPWFLPYRVGTLDPTRSRLLLDGVLAVGRAVT